MLSSQELYALVQLWVHALALAPSSVLRGLRRLAFRAGRALAARRRREGEFQPSYRDSRHQLTWLLQDALTVLAEPAESSGGDGKG